MSKFLVLEIKVRVG